MNKTDREIGDAVAEEFEWDIKVDQRAIQVDVRERDWDVFVPKSIRSNASDGRVISAAQRGRSALDRALADAPTPSCSEPGGRHRGVATKDGVYGRIATFRTPSR